MHTGERHGHGNQNECIISGLWYLFLSGCLRYPALYNCLLALSLANIFINSSSISLCLSEGYGLFKMKVIISRWCLTTCPICKGNLSSLC